MEWYKTYLVKLKVSFFNYRFKNRSEKRALSCLSVLAALLKKVQTGLQDRKFFNMIQS